MSYLQYVFVCVCAVVCKQSWKEEGNVVLKGPVCEKVVKYRHFGVATVPTYDPKASGFDVLEMRLKNILFLQIRPFE